jgi:hypothetical protein
MPKEQPPPPQPPSTLVEKIARANAELEKWSKLAASPNLSPEAALAAREAARSYAAAVKLYGKALAAWGDPEKPDREHQLFPQSLNIPLPQAAQSKLSLSVAKSVESSPPPLPRGPPQTSPPRISNKHAGTQQKDQSAVAQPRKPMPSDFGITESDINKEPNLIFDLSNKNGVGPGPFLVATAFAVTFLMDYHFTIVPAIIFGLVLTVLCFAILEGLEKKIKLANNPALVKATEYRNALDAFKEKQKAYEILLEKQREEYWKGLSGIRFEAELGQLFETLGYEVSQTPLTGDGGVDLVLIKDGQKTVVQCKAHNRKITIDVARELVASMQDFGAQLGIIACFEGITAPTREYIALKNITVMEVREIVALQRAINSGVTTT